MLGGTHDTRSGIEFEGVALFEECVTAREEEALVAHLDATPWVPSQAGRRKQVSALFVKHTSYIRHHTTRGCPAFLVGLGWIRWTGYSVLTLLSTILQASSPSPPAIYA